MAGFRCPLFVLGLSAPPITNIGGSAGMARARTRAAMVEERGRQGTVLLRERGGLVEARARHSWRGWLSRAGISGEDH